MVMALLIGQAGYAKKNVDQLFKEFRSERNVSKVSIGKITLKLANLFTDTMGVDGIEILEFDDCDQSVKDRLHAAVRELRDPGYETMVSENDEDGRTRVLVKIHDDRIRALVVITSGDDNTLVRIKGNIKPDDIDRMVNGSKTANR